MYPPVVARSLDITLLTFMVMMQKSPIAKNCLINFKRLLYGWISHKVNLGLLREYHIIRKLVTITRPGSPGFPLVSSTASIISNIFSPLRSFLWLRKTELLEKICLLIPSLSRHVCVWGIINSHVWYIKFHFSILPNFLVTTWHVFRLLYLVFIIELERF